MTAALTFECDIHFRRCGKGARKELEPGAETLCPAAPGRVPRVSRLMALAIHFEGMVNAGVLTDYGELARLGKVTRARITQIMNLLLLAPDIQEALLFLPRVEWGRDPSSCATCSPSPPPSTGRSNGGCGRISNGARPIRTLTGTILATEVLLMSSTYANRTWRIAHTRDTSQHALRALRRNRRRGEPMAATYTLGKLLDDLQGSEAAYQANMRAADLREAKDGHNLVAYSMRV